MGGFVFEHASSQEVPERCLPDGPHCCPSATKSMRRPGISRCGMVTVTQLHITVELLLLLERQPCWKGHNNNNNNKGFMAEGRILVGFSVPFCVILLLSSMFGYLVKEVSQVALQETFHVSVTVAYHRRVPVDQCVSQFVTVGSCFTHVSPPVHWVFHFYSDVSSTDEEVWCYTCGCNHDAYQVPWPTHSLQYNTHQVRIEANNRASMFLEWRLLLSITHTSQGMPRLRLGGDGNPMSGILQAEQAKQSCLSTTRLLSGLAS